MTRAAFEARSLFNRSRAAISSSSVNSESGLVDRLTKPSKRTPSGGFGATDGSYRGSLAKLTALGARAEQTGRDTVSDGYLFANHRSQEPRRSLSSHEPATAVNAASLPGNPERYDIVGDSANHVGIC